RSFLRTNAMVDAQTTAGGPTIWGAGKLCMKGCVGPAVAVDDGVEGLLAFAPPFPNPSPGSLTFDLFLSPSDLEPGIKAAIEIRDVRGRLISTLPVESTPGPQRLIWDGLARNGQPAAPGLYFGRFELGHQTSVRKFVLLERVR